MTARANMSKQNMVLNNDGYNLKHDADCGNDWAHNTYGPSDGV